MALVALDRIGRPGSTKDIMEAGPKPSDWEVLAGIVERVIYQNAENGFTVIRAKVRGHREPVTVVGHAAFMSAAERITATGERLNDPTYGQQVKANSLKTSAPTSIEGIARYLASGMIRGVGPVYAKKLLRAFRENVSDVIETETDRLREVAGIGPVRASCIVPAWVRQKACSVTPSHRISRRECHSTRNPAAETKSSKQRTFLSTRWHRMIAKKGLPALRRWSPSLCHVFCCGRPPDIDVNAIAEMGEISMI